MTHSVDLPAEGSQGGIQSRRRSSVVAKAIDRAAERIPPSGGNNNSLSGFASSFTRSTGFAALRANSQSKKRSEAGIAVAADHVSAEQSLLTETTPFLEDANGSVAEDFLSAHDIDESAVADSSGEDDQESALLGDSFGLQKVRDEDGNLVSIVIGHSTREQTIFNAVNILMGIGLLSIPLAFEYSGWIFGILLLLFSSTVTLYTARLLANCMQTDHSLLTYADVSWLAFGDRTRIIVSALFSFELMATCVASCLIFADSMHVLFPDVPVDHFKYISFFIFLPLSFMPLHILSYSSIVGIIGTTALLVLITVQGLTTQEQPGSITNPLSTTAFPRQPYALPLAIGLFMAPWGGHTILPQVYRDMRRPTQFQSAMSISWSLTLVADLSMGVVGWLMFGRNIGVEVTQSVLGVKHYSDIVKILVLGICAAVSITKFPLGTQPVCTTVERMLHVENRSQPVHACLHILIRLFTVALPIVIAIWVPAFDRIMVTLHPQRNLLIKGLHGCRFMLYHFGYSANYLPHPHLW